MNGMCPRGGTRSDDDVDAVVMMKVHPDAHVSRSKLGVGRRFRGVRRGPRAPR
jgi:hypothetical protein